MLGGGQGALSSRGTPRAMLCQWSPLCPLRRPASPCVDIIRLTDGPPAARAARKAMRCYLQCALWWIPGAAKYRDRPRLFGAYSHTHIVANAR